MSWNRILGNESGPVSSYLIMSRLNYLAEMLRYHVGLTDDDSRAELTGIARALHQEGSLIGDTLVHVLGTGNQTTIDRELCRIVDELRTIQRGMEEDPEHWDQRGQRLSVLRWISKSWANRER